jgi:L-ascorbate metabolism protein UlaG (beta-lactamase superfamily)
VRIDWYGQSAFKLVAEQTVFIDPFGDMSAAASHGLVWEYPPIEAVDSDLLLVTHEHADHNGIEAITGDPALIRSSAGSHESPIDTVIGVASEHDEAAGTQRGANVIYVFTFGGVRIAHFGDFGQAALRPEQREAIGDVELLFVPVGGMATIDAAQAAELVETLGPKWVVPMHYRTPRINFLEPADAFLGMFDNVERCSEPGFDTDALQPTDGPLVIVPTAP